MEYKKIYKNIQIPVLGLGTWKIGGNFEADFRNDKKDIELIKNALDLMITHIDTAEAYGAGHCEEIIGQAIKGRDRKKLFITTKVSYKNLAYDNVFRSMDDSLNRLGTDYVDLYLVHSPSDDVPINETMEAFDKLVELGKTKLIGVSNFSVKQIKEAQKYSINKIVANQIEYSLFVRNDGEFVKNVEKDIIPFCQENEIGVIAYRPLAKGKIPFIKNQLLHRLAAKYSKTPAQIALNWLITKNNIISIPKSSNVNELKENLKSVGWRMDSEDILELDCIKEEKIYN